MNLKDYVALHGQTGTAKLLGVSQGLVWQWLVGRTTITAEKAVLIEQRTAGAIKRHELRPDLFGESSSQVAA